MTIYSVIAMLDAIARDAFDVWSGSNFFKRNCFDSGRKFAGRTHPPPLTVINPR